MQSLKQKTNLMFYQIISIGLIFLSLIIFLAINLYPKIILIAKSLLHKLETICGCANHWSFSMHPFIFSFVIFTGLVLAIFIILIIIKIFRLNQSTKKFIKFYIKKCKQKLSIKLEKTANIIGLTNKLVEIKSNQPVIFCYNFIRPKICISEMIVKKLNSQELLAVLKHEQHHLLSYEPLKIFLTKIISKILFFIIDIKLLIQKYQILLEFTADEQATQGFKNKASLTSALEKVMRLKEQMIIKNNLAISFFSAIDERVNKLTDDRYMPNVNFFTLKFLASLFIIFVFIASFYIPVYSAQSSMLNHSEDMCLHSKTTVDDNCIMSMDENTCSMNVSEC